MVGDELGWQIYCRLFHRYHLRVHDVKLATEWLRERRESTSWFSDGSIIHLNDKEVAAELKLMFG